MIGIAGTIAASAVAMSATKGKYDLIVLPVTAVALAVCLFATAVGWRA